MDYNALIGILGFVLMMVLIVFRCPIYLAMLISGLAGMALITTPGMTFIQLTSAPFASAASYSFALLPMFMLMGVLTQETGIAEGAFTSSQKWLGRTRGGLLNTVIVANALFGACSGSANAGIVVFSRLSLPSLDKAGYERGNALACIAASSSLASLIPPSTAILMSCLITNLSITKGLLCGVGAGVMTTILLIVTVIILSRLTNKIPPPASEKVPFIEKIKSLRLLIPIVCLFVIIIVGASSGFFTATVGGAVGSFAVGVYALFKKMPVKRVFEAAKDAATINASIFPMLLGGTLFGRFVTLSHLPQTFITLIQQINATPFIVFTIIVIFYLICGCLMDMLAIILITVPIVFPLLTSMGFEEYSLLIMLVYVTSIGAITPPIGMSVFVTANTAHTDPSEIFRGIIPYFLVMLASLYLICFIPEIVTFLPTICGL